jgi:hypothetical protein
VRRLMPGPDACPTTRPCRYRCHSARWTQITRSLSYHAPHPAYHAPPPAYHAPHRAYYAPRPFRWASITRSCPTTHPPGPPHPPPWFAVLWGTTRPLHAPSDRGPSTRPPLGLFCIAALPEPARLARATGGRAPLVLLKSLTANVLQRLLTPLAIPRDSRSATFHGGPISPLVPLAFHGRRPERAGSSNGSRSYYVGVVLDARTARPGPH